MCHKQNKQMPYYMQIVAGSDAVLNAVGWFVLV